MRRRLELGVETTINERYRLRSEISADGDIVRYVADDERGERRVILAVVHDELAADAEFATAVRTQVRKLARAPRGQLTLQEIYDCNVSDDGVLFVALEATDGRTLEALLEAEGPLERRRALRLARQLGEGLEALHHVGIVHGELRPQAVLVVGEPDGAESVKLLGVELTAAHRTAIGLRRRDASLEPYLAPEQIERGDATEATDVHALGRLLREMVAPAPSAETDRRHARRAVPAAIERIVAKALDPQPGQRYTDMTLMVNDICVALGELEDVTARLRTRLVKTGAVAAAALVVVTIASLALSERITSRVRARIPTAAPLATPAQREARTAPQETMQAPALNQTTSAPAPGRSTPATAERDTTPTPPNGVASMPGVAPARTDEPTRTTEPARTDEPARTTEPARTDEPARTAEPTPTVSQPRPVDNLAKAPSPTQTAAPPVRRPSPSAFVGSTAPPPAASSPSQQRALTSEAPAQRATTSEPSVRRAPASEAGTDPADGSAVIDWLFKDRRGG